MKLHLLTALLALCVFNTFNAFSQGKIMIVGGGTENYNGWSDIPYTWAVDNSANKRVAIVSYSNPSNPNWLPDYFLSLGAVAAKNFTINTTAIANAQATYDSLMTYDVIFFRGGNQANYYLTYKNTKTHDAITDKFNSGGVIAGTSAGLHILSGVVFTAESGTAYSDECLKNIFHSSITLKNDFLDIMPGYIFDSHFVERGRMARLLAFMARWKNDHNEKLTGIGVDDMTAFCIDASDTANITGYAYGTAAVNFYRQGELGHQENRLFAKDVETTQLLHNCSINLNTFEVSGFGSQMTVEHTHEFGNRTLLLSGTDPVSENQLFISHLVDSVAWPSAPMLIITGAGTTLASAYKQAFTGAGATNVEIGQALPANLYDPGLQALIEQAEVIVFIGNSYQTLFDFIFSGSGNGELLLNKINAPEAKVAFVGDNSRLAGAQVVSDNYITNANASFNGQLSFNPGLNLLTTMVVMPNTYLYSTDYYENTNSAIPYAMLEKQVHRGVWLTVRNFMKYYIEMLDIYITVYGESPAMILTNQDSRYDLNAQIFRNRQVGGFEYMDFRTLLYPNRILVGDMVYGIRSNEKMFDLSAYYDAKAKQIIISADIDFPGNLRMKLYNISGQIVKKEHKMLQTGKQLITLDVPELTGGLYILQLQTNNGTASSKLMITR